MAYDFKAATLSTNGLILALGTTAEVQNGLIGVCGTTEWLSRLISKGYNTGPTGAWKGEWISVYQYLYYGAGRCFIGSTGACGGYTGFSLTNTPLHNTAITDFDVVFDCGGSTFSAGAAAHIAKTRQDCIALIGNNADIYGIDNPFTGQTTYFQGFTSGSTEYIAYIAGRKQIDIKSIYSGWRSSYITTNCSADVAGLMAYNSSDSDISTVVSGIGNNKAIKNVINLTQQYSDAEAASFINGGTNPVRQFAGVGVFLMGNKTYKNNSTSILNRLNIMITLNYLKRTLKPILGEYLFKPNSAAIRSEVRARVNQFLSGLYIFSVAAGGSYVVVCDATNNSNPNTLTVDVTVTIAPNIESVTLNIVNSEDNTTISTTTIS